MDKWQVHKNLDILLNELKKRSMPLPALISFCEQTFTPKPSSAEMNSYIIELLNRGLMSNIHNNEYSITITGRLFIGYEEEEKKKQDDKDTEDKKLVLHYVYYTIATAGILFALIRGCDNSKNNQSYKHHNSCGHHIKK